VQVIMLRILFVLTAAQFAAFSAFAWGDLGHRIICQIAHEELKKAAAVRLAAILNEALTPGL
jgi:hypothetical protein